MTVSAALQWAWRDELPKMPAAERPAGLSAASAWASILRYGELHSIIDRQPNRYGCVPFDVAGWPHADALRIAEAVEALAGLVVEVPDGWNPAPELVAIDADLARKAVDDTLRAAIVERDGEMVFRVAADVLVVRHAILGTVPQWRMDLPEATVETGEGGRPKWYVLREIPTVVGTNPDGSDRIVTETIGGRRLVVAQAAAAARSLSAPEIRPGPGAGDGRARGIRDFCRGDDASRGRSCRPARDNRDRRRRMAGATVVRVAGFVEKSPDAENSSGPGSGEAVRRRDEKTNRINDLGKH